MLAGADLREWVEHLPAEALKASEILADWVSWWRGVWEQTEQDVLAATHHVGGGHDALLACARYLPNLVRRDGAMIDR